MFTSLYSGFLRRCFRAAGLSSQSIDLDDKTTLHYWGPTEISKTQKPSLVLIHGFGPMAIWQWRQQVQFFSTHFNVYVPDLIFFGQSTTKSSERSENFQAVCVVKLMEKLEVKKFDVVGTSYGGFVAYHLATMLGEERVEKVVIASSGVNMRKSDNVALLERAEMDKIEDLMLPSTPQHLRKLMALSVSSMRFYIPDFFLKDFLNKLYSENRKEKMELLHGLSLGRDDTSIITPLQQEVLIIWGENDQIFPVHKAHELKEVISNNKVKLELIKNASHVPQIEKPAEFNNIILNFLHRTT
ncbi:PREDICTED: uncharacterized protein LOC109327323 isoform X1 [Lupinus angustifolius]|uniref:uncharacterized protein LOC109327323 isoform X1 n=1 Tax=Lupinus angustifolius TaxID=3871 RepID=UPI00092F75E2|nr:PREDICTED: uncharacterized protein LOC109327323 isoform X1 [Lupinus angustifolius]